MYFGIFFGVFFLGGGGRGTKMVFVLKIDISKMLFLYFCTILYMSNGAISSVYFEIFFNHGEYDISDWNWLNVKILEQSHRWILKIGQTQLFQSNPAVEVFHQPWFMYLQSIFVINIIFLEQPRCMNLKHWKLLKCDHSGAILQVKLQHFLQPGWIYLWSTFIVYKFWSRHGEWSYAR